MSLMKLNMGNFRDFLKVGFRMKEQLVLLM